MNIHAVTSLWHLVEVSSSTTAEETGSGRAGFSADVTLLKTAGGCQQIIQNIILNSCYTGGKNPLWVLRI